MTRKCDNPCTSKRKHWSYFDSDMITDKNVCRKASFVDKSAYIRINTIILSVAKYSWKLLTTKKNLHVRNLYRYRC